MTDCGSFKLSNETEHKVHDAGSAEAGGRRRVLHLLIEPTFMITGVALLVLTIIWAVTLNLTEREYDAADRTAAALSADVANTYEAQVVRALGEIDHVLRMIRFHLESEAAEEVLDVLGARDLLPPQLLFTISIADARGEVLASNDPEFGDSVASRDHFLRARDEEGMVVGAPHRNGTADEWQLTFARRIVDDQGAFSGVVAVTTYAEYFVSGYDARIMGELGMLGLLGTDGVFRVRRTGDTVTAGTEIDFTSIVSDDDPGPQESAEVATNHWDDVRRYTIARKLFQFPLAIVVGLSEQERLAPADALQRTYMWRAGGASLAVVAILALLGRLSWQLQRARVQVVEERLAHARRVEYMAFHDSLTDLPNRAFFSHLLTQSIRHSRRYGNRIALLFLDLDRFKAVNDSLGHDAGDELLRQVARRLTDTLRESDIVARLGGDEFVVLLSEVTETTQAAKAAEKILSAVGKSFSLAGQELRITVSVGISLFPDDGEDEQTLIKNADVAMYSAKEAGKNNFRFYSKELTTESLERLALETSLRKALERDEFRLFYQAKRDMTTGKISGMEALLRWDHPDLGLIPPMQFIPLAEENGLIVPIGRWVIQTACQQNVDWQMQGFPRLSMAVNLSARQFLEDGLIDDIRHALKASGMAPELLELEITETTIMRDMKKTIKVLHELKRMGVRLAIDDFGTGYSSLSTLKEFPLDTIKIDGSFVRGVDSNAEDRGLTDAVIAVGKSLGLTVVAEGVESQGQADFLRTHLCDQFQGFYINKPMPAEEFAHLLAETNGRE